MPACVSIIVHICVPVPASIPLLAVSYFSTVCYSAAMSPVAG